MLSDTYLIPDAGGDIIGKMINEKERVRKDRFSCLESQTKDFSGALAVLNDIKV
jgi:hypothetical protein